MDHANEAGCSPMPASAAPPPAPVLVYRNKNDIEPYNKIVVPSSMRSNYWKFFGFPANKYNEITNKSRIVCAICGASIAYNKNTTNLQTHLSTRHPEIVREYFSRTGKKRCGIKMSQSMVETVDEHASWQESTRIKVKMVVSQPHPTGIVTKTSVKSEPMSDEQETADDEDNIDEHDGPNTTEYTGLHCDGIETLSENLVYADGDDLLTDYPTTVSLSVESVGANVMCDDVTATDEQMDETGRRSTSMLECDIDMVAELSKLVVTDLLPLEFIEGEGFQRLMKKLIGRLELPKSAAVLSQKFITIMFCSPFSSSYFIFSGSSIR